MIYEVHNFQSVYDDFGGSSVGVYVTYRNGGGDFQAFTALPGEVNSFQAVVGTVNFYPAPSEFAISDIGDTGLTWDDSPVTYDPLDVDISISDVGAPGGNDGAITVNVSGGSGNFSFLWADGPITQNRIGLVAGVYTVTVTDTTTGLTNVNVIEIADGVPALYPPLIVTSDVVDVTANGGSDGVINVNVVGGSDVYSYAWSNGAITQDLAGIVSGNYTLTVTDTTTGFIVTKNFYISQPDALLFDAIDVVLDSLVNVSAFGGSDGAINITVSGGSGSFIYIWNNGANTPDIAGLSAGVYNLTILDTITTLVRLASFNVSELDALSVSKSSTNGTAAGADDGSITLVVSGGSGEYSFAWGDGPVTQNRSALPPGTYSVTVTDLVTGEEITVINIVITEPVEEPEVEPFFIGTFFQVPRMNSLHYVVEEPGEPETPDNTLFCQQDHAGYKPENYYQKVQKDDAIKTQINSDYPYHTCKLYNYVTNALVKSFDVVLKEQNVDKESEFDITIRNHTVINQSRIYFNGESAIPLPLLVGNSFKIVNNADGFNGAFVIVSIANDVSLNQDYLVINRDYDIIPFTSSGSAIFTTSNEDFNVFEAAHDFIDVADGVYQMIIVASDDGGNTETAKSEPISIKVSHPGTKLFKFQSIDNSLDITWTTGIIGIMRVEGRLFKRLPGGERSLSRNSDFSLVKTAAKAQRLFEWEIIECPPYVHEKIAFAVDLDTWSLNKVRYQTSDGYDKPQYIDLNPISNSSIVVEQIGAFRGYNSDDITSIEDGGFIANETGFIKR